MNASSLSATPESVGEGVPPPSALAPVWDILDRVRTRVFGDPAVPTLMHVTHAKAGSTWLVYLLQELFRSRVAPRGTLVAEATGGDVDRHQFAPGRVYRAMFLTRERFLAHPELHDIKRFVVIRDLRDTLVSLYFSLKVSHPLDARSKTQEDRDRLNALSLDEGMQFLLEERLGGPAGIQSSWLNHGEIVLRYEDLLTRSYPLLRELFQERLALPVSDAALARAIRRTHFETVFKRKLGEEDVKSHGRRGLPGDWRNYFSAEMRRRFAERYGELLIQTGYEKDCAWAQ